MMATAREWLKAAARLGALGATAFLLVATTALPTPPYWSCPKYTAPVAFEASGTCSAGGVVVMEPSNCHDFTIWNSEALGWSSLKATSDHEEPFGQRTQTVAYFPDDQCPQAFATGGWRIESWLCPVLPDAGTGDDAYDPDGAAPTDGAAPDDGAVEDAGYAETPRGDNSTTVICPVVRRCTTAPDGNDLLMTCTDGATGAELCTMTLRAIP